MGITGGASDGVPATPPPEAISLTTPARVRNRVNLTKYDIPDSAIQEFIDDDQAHIEEFAQKTFLESDPQFGIARNICTDRGAARSLLYLENLNPSVTYTIDEFRVDKTDVVNARVAWAAALWARADKMLSLLIPVKPSSLLPRSSTS